MHQRIRVLFRPLTLLAVSSALVLLTTAAWGQGGTSLVVNHFVSDPEVIEGHLVISDVEGRGGQVSIAFHDDKGALVANATENIPANGKLNLNPENYVRGRKLTGTIRINSQRTVAGQYWQFYKTAALGWKNIAVPAALAPGSTKLVCQHFVADPSIESYLVIADAEGTGPTVYVEFYSDQGELAGQTKVTIPKNGKFSLQPYDLVGRKQMTGVAFIQTEGGKITGEYWQVSEREKYQVAHPMQGGAPVAAVIVDDPITRVKVEFDFDSDKIQKRSHADLLEVAKAMNDPKNKGVRYEVGGHTDNVGKDDYNLKLSDRRAKSVKDFLVKTGKVDAKRLDAKGYGPKEPIVPNDTPANRAVNRRVEFKKI